MGIAVVVIVAIIIVITAHTPQLAPHCAVRKICGVYVDVILLRLLNDVSDQSWVYVAHASSGCAAFIWWSKRYYYWPCFVNCAGMDVSTRGWQRNIGNSDYKAHFAFFRA